MFIYFDLGNVVLNFSHELMCRQVCAVTGTDVAKVRDLLFTQKLKERAEAGQCTRDEFYAALCEGLCAEPEAADIERAINDTFQHSGIRSLEFT